jgi:hypothetical protein
MYSTSYSVEPPTFSIVTVVVKNVSFTPNAVDTLTLSVLDAVPIHAADRRSAVDTSVTVVGEMSCIPARPLHRNLQR